MQISTKFKEEISQCEGREGEYFRQSKCPCTAAPSQAVAFQAHPFSCKNFKISKNPALAAIKHGLGHPSEYLQ
jgi:hypothetical protein